MTSRDLEMAARWVLQLAAEYHLPETLVSRWIDRIIPIIEAVREMERTVVPASARQMTQPVRRVEGNVIFLSKSDLCRLPAAPTGGAA